MRKQFVRHSRSGAIYAVRLDHGIVVTAAGPVRSREVVLELLDEILRTATPDLVARLNTAEFRAIRAPHL